MLSQSVTGLTVTAWDKCVYEMTIWIGMRKGSGTTARVSFMLTGDKGETQLRMFDDFKRHILHGVKWLQFCWRLQNPNAPTVTVASVDGLTSRFLLYDVGQYLVLRKRRQWRFYLILEAVVYAISSNFPIAVVNVKTLGPTFFHGNNNFTVTILKMSIL